MGTRQTLDVLEAYAAIIHKSGDATAAEAVSALRSALLVAGNATIKATAAKIQKTWSPAGEPGFSAPQLVARLQALEKLLLIGGGKAVAADLAILVDLVSERRAVTPREFEAVLRDAILSQPPKPAPKKSGKQPKREPLSAAEVRRLADRLTAATTDQDAFEAELAGILAIPRLSVSELTAIAEHYLGYEPPKGKAGILKKLRTRQMQDAMEAGRQSRIQRIAV